MWPSLLALALAACALVQRPEVELAIARTAVTDAESAGAAERAPNELAAARDKLTRAESHARRGHFDEAQALAVEAEADARLAAIRARAVNAETARDAVQRARQSQSGVGRMP